MRALMIDPYLTHLAEQGILLAEIGVAALLGGAVGFERERADKPAGLRTHMLVAASAALLVGLADSMVGSLGQTSQVQADPIRVLEAIITGVAFLGAGTIIQRRRTRSVEGLTTAASLLLVASVGAAVALDRLVLAVGVTVLTLLILRTVETAERRWGVKRGSVSDSPGDTAPAVTETGPPTDATDADC